MTDFFSPEDEVERLRVVRSYEILDTAAEEAYDRITTLAADVFQVPVAMVSVVDQDRIWFKSRYGLDVTEVPRSAGLCASAILQKEPFVIGNTASAGRSLISPVTNWNLDVRFYAGAPLTTPGGFNLGALCLIDTKPRVLSMRELARLQELAWLVMHQLELRLEAIKTKVKLINLKSSGDNVGLVHREFASALAPSFDFGFCPVVGEGGTLAIPAKQNSTYSESGLASGKIDRGVFPACCTKIRPEILGTGMLPVTGCSG